MGMNPSTTAVALETYLFNNWDRFRAKQLKDLGLDFVSARAESQVRDRTKDRYAVPGAWRQENLEGKATLRAIIADGRWSAFRADYLHHHRTRFDEMLRQRIALAVKEGRLLPCDPALAATQIPSPTPAHLNATPPTLRAAA